MSDRELREAVEEALDWEPIIDAKGIGVSAKEGVVTLSGHVPSYPQKRESEKAAALIRGVKAVVCELQVRLPLTSETSDEEIARAAVNAIAWNTLLQRDKIKVCVDQGRITLEGAVDWQYQRKSADQCVRYLSGVRDVNNHIVVEPHANQAAIKQRIEAALLRNVQLEAHRIRVEIREDRVILTGNVLSWVEREEAERAAWASPGVCDVENLLLVNPVSNLVAH